MSDDGPARDDDTVPPAIDSRAAFADAVRWSVRCSLAAAARRIVWVDRDFAEWPLDDPALHADLSTWLRLPQRRLVLLAADYTVLPRSHPRFVGWRRLWSHAVEAWSPSDEAVAKDLPTLAIDEGAVCLHLADAIHWRGSAVLDKRAARLWRDQIEAVLQRSEPAFPVSTLGL